MSLSGENDMDIGEVEISGRLAEMTDQDLLVLMFITRLELVRRGLSPRRLNKLARAAVKEGRRDVATR